MPANKHLLNTDQPGQPGHYFSSDKFLFDKNQADLLRYRQHEYNAINRTVVKIVFLILIILLIFQIIFIKLLLQGFFK